MNVLTAERVMRICAERIHKPRWIELGQIISRKLDKMDEANAEDIAEAVIAAYRGKDGATADME